MQKRVASHLSTLPLIHTIVTVTSQFPYNRTN
nr:MAG TPA: hypothetical protein [Bacteriophage sp.]